MSGTASVKIEEHECREENAETFLSWIKGRGGIAVWRSINLSNPGRTWSTPATCHPLVHNHISGRAVEDKTKTIPYPKPTWEAENEPERIITDPEHVRVFRDHEVKRFHVAIRVGSQGFMLKCTDGSSNRIRKAVAKAGEGAYHKFDYSTQEAVIMAPVKSWTLAEWARLKENGELPK